MRSALIASAAGHALIIGWGLVSLPSADTLSSLEKPLPVDLVTVAEFTEIQAGQEKAEPKDVPAPPKPKPDVVEAARETEKPAAAKTQSTAPEITETPKPQELRTAALPPEPTPRPEPAPAPAAPPEPEPAPKPEPREVTEEPAPQPTNVPVPPARPKPPERPKEKVAEAPEPKPAPPAPKPEQGGFDADRIAALLNKVPQSGGAVTGTGTTDPGQGMPDGQGATLTMSEIDALRRQISRCWNPPIGVLDAGHMVVKLDIAFNQDGSLTREPRLLNANGQQIFMIAAEAAIRAVMSCQPYSLPPEKYDLWQQVHVNFDPREMLGG